MLSGSREERDAIERADELRRERVGGSRVPASQKIEGGEIVVFFHPPRRRKRKELPSAPHVFRYDDGFEVEA